MINGTGNRSQSVIMCTLLVARLIEVVFRHLIVRGSCTLAIACRVNSVAMGLQVNTLRNTQIGQRQRSKAMYTQCATCHLGEAMPVIRRFWSTMEILIRKTVKKNMG